ncbi:small GTP-binding protein [Candidatus Rickettsiella viridis]|uniref:Small GTP-binding protein n=1 Tax=Candidatus Rickettsiella viridis TaxID=676208 RepID=A0A2Z5UVH2_9COXI|nr:GTP-binding protein [Candidatus Rickettsiella viridis]BBB15626.1 small GTP-binding protein [Candidatus Rickettsiella viridis]
MLSVDNKIISVIIVGNVEAGKTALMNRLVGKEFPFNYAPTTGVDFFLLRKKPIKFHMWDLSGAVRFEHLRKSFYKQLLREQASIVIYVLDSTKDVEENKRIFQEFNREINAEVSISNCLQLIVFNKSDDENSKLSQAYIPEFNAINVPYIVCSAKTGMGVEKIGEYFNDVSGLVSTEELLLSKIEEYSKVLDKKHSQIAKNKSTALEAIASACRSRGMGKGSLSTAQIVEIKRIIRDEKEIIKQHRHWSVFNCFFNLVGAVSPLVLERRVTSHNLWIELDNYLSTQSESLRSSLNYRV